MDCTNPSKEKDQATDRQALQTWLQLLKCSKRMEQTANSHLDKTFNSSLARFDVLANLAMLDGASISTSRLAHSLLASKGNITRLLDRMEEDQLIHRKPNREDRRISDILLADKGHAEYKRMALDHQQWVEEVFEVLSGAEKVSLIEILGKLRRQLDSL